MSLAIEAQGLGRRFGTREAVRDLTFEVRTGEIFGFLGPNGAGKTTTLKMLTGRLQPSTGQVRVLELDPQREGPRLRCQLGIMGESPGHYERLTAVGNLRFFARLYGAPPERPMELLEQVGLGARARDPVSTLSKGMRQRLALARSLVGQPRLLFLDEPTAGLDPLAAAAVRQLIEAFRSQGGTVFLTTHYLEEAESLCQRVAILDRGRLLALDSPGGLCRSILGQDLVLPAQRASLAGVFLSLTGRSLDPTDESTCREGSPP